MAKIEQHDMAEYYITSEMLDIGAGTATWYFGVPQAGYLVRAYYTTGVVQTTANNILTFAIETNDLSPTLIVLSAASAVGRVHVVDFSRISGSYAHEPEDTDLIAAGGVIAVDTNGGGEGEGRITLVIHP